MKFLLPVLAAIALFFYMRFIEPGRLKLVTGDVVAVQGLTGEPVRVLLLGDFHVSGRAALALTEKAIALGLAEKPDLVLLVGDFFMQRLTDQELQSYVDVLKPLSAQLPVFACLGDHDGGAWSRKHGGWSDLEKARHLLQESGIRLLLNASDTVTVRGTRFQIVGLGDQWAGMANPEKAFAAVTDTLPGPVLVLAHNPDLKSVLSGWQWDLLLSGHTHGGQFRIPILGTPFAPVRDKSLVGGLHVRDGRPILITRGVGCIYGLRFNCRPEVNLFTLVSAR